VFKLQIRMPLPLREASLPPWQTSACETIPREHYAIAIVAELLTVASNQGEAWTVSWKVASFSTEGWHRCSVDGKARLQQKSI